MKQLHLFSPSFHASVPLVGQNLSISGLGAHGALAGEHIGPKVGQRQMI
jgi:hypothetical protein